MAGVGRDAAKQLLLFGFCLFVGLPGTAEAQVPLRSVAQLTVDDEGRTLNYPSIVFYDPWEDEVYLVNGGTGRVVVYGADFFPAVSIGVGRGVEAPRSGVVQNNGDVYLLQTQNVKSARPRITVLSGAFFVKNEIFLDTIADVSDFRPRSIAISREGLIYVAGNNSRGVLVLDQQGSYLRHLRPLDRVSGDQNVIADEAVTTTDASLETGSIVSTPEQPFLSADIPEEFRPRTGGRQERSRSSVDNNVLNPVRINDVQIDSRARIYLLSAETSKIYVYDGGERFLFSFGSKGGTPRHMSQPRSLAIDEARGLIFVADYMRHTILAYNLEGRYLFEFGGRGVGPGWFNFPEDISINNQGQLVIADLFNRRVQVLEILYDEFPPNLKALVTPGIAEVTATDRVRSSPVSDFVEEVEQVEGGDDLWELIADDLLLEEEVADIAGEPGYSFESPEFFLRRWAAAWSARDVDLYLSFYAGAFVPMEEIGRDEWQRQRYEQMRRAEYIEVILEDIEIHRSGPSRVRVTAVQHYHSDSRVTRMRKIFELQHEEGGWRIFRERSVEVLDD